MNERTNETRKRLILIYLGIAWLSLIAGAAVVYGHERHHRGDRANVNCGWFWCNRGGK